MKHLPSHWNLGEKRYTPENLNKPQKIAGFRSMTIPFRLKNGPFLRGHSLLFRRVGLGLLQERQLRNIPRTTWHQNEQPYWESP